MTATAVTPHLDSSLRTGSRGRIVLIVVVAVLVGAVAFKAYRLTLPTDGWSLLPPVEMPTFGENLLTDASPLRPGDVLVGVNGIPYFEVIGAAVSGQAAPIDYRAGATSTYTVWRDDAEVELEVPIAYWSPAGIGRAAWRTLLDTPLGGVYRWLAWLIAAYVFYRRPANQSAGLLFLLESVTLSMAISTMVAPVTVADALSPALFYAARIWGDLTAWLVLPPLALHFLLVFPGVRQVPRWLVAVVYGVPWLVFALVWLTGVAVMVPLLAGAYSLANLVAVVVLVARDGAGTERTRVRWLAFGFGLAGAFSLLFWLHQAGWVPEVPVLSTLLFEHCVCDLIYVTCIAVALLRHRLFDIDVIIRRTLVYGGLTLAVVVVYAGLVGGVGRLVGREASWPLSLAATGVVALAFDPLRSSLQRIVNRLVYGYRDEPYQVLTRLGQRLELSQRPAAALGDAAKSIADALKLPYVAVEVAGATVASHGEPREHTERLDLVHAGALLGALLVSPRPGEERVPRADQGLLQAVAGQVAAAVHAYRLEVDLESSRLASINAREETRRRLGSDLHDDIGHRLTALVQQVQRAGQLVDTDPAGTKRSLAVLVDEVRAVASRVRALAHQLHPPELALLGLSQAVRERLSVMAESQTLHVHFEAGELGELPAAVELGAYSVVQEALSNVVKHSGAGNCWVRLARTRVTPSTGAALLGDRMLLVEVVDDGVGLGANPASPGLGSASMRARAHELGGSLTIDRPPAGGTRVRFSVPLPDAPDIGD